MKPHYLFILIALSVSLNACADKKAPPVVVTPVSTEVTGPTDLNQAAGIQASGLVVPVKFTELSFLEPAPVKEILVTLGDQVTTGQALVVLDVPKLEYAVIGAQAAVDSAVSFARLQRFRRTILNQKGKSLYLTGPHEVLEVADAKVTQAQAGLEKAQAELARSRLIAPYSGTIVEINAGVGKFIPASDPVVILADLSLYQIETTDLNERDISKLHIGQLAEIQIPALDLSLSGSITQISPRAENIDGDIVYKIILGLDPQQDGLKWGMSADVFFRDE
jgi:RND family efflux transporter MFP subunit